MSARITRHIVTVGQRRVHYHRAGEGPVIVLLHASACSAKVMREHLEKFSEDHTAIAFDTPGFGLSDLLAQEQPTTEDLADALAQTLSALGIEQVAVYGRHTGAQIAVEFAARHPDRCSMALTNGFPVYSAEEKARRLASYLPPIVPAFDGSHLLWIWFRYREQHVFWPWNAQDLEHRADTDVPDLDFLHRGVIEMLEAGDSYRIGYATAYRHRGPEVVADLKVPVCFGGRPGDSQGHTPGLMPAGTWTHNMPRDAQAALQAEHELLRRHPARRVAPAAPRCTELPGRTTLDYLDVDGVQVLTRSVGDLRSVPPLILIHHAPGSSALYDSLVREIGKQHPVLALDLPGHGESDPLPNAMQSVAAWSALVVRTLELMQIDRYHLMGHNGGAAVVIEIALARPEQALSLILDAPISLNDNEREYLCAGWLQDVEPLTPCWDGSHLLRAWHMRRDMELWWPWFDRRHQNARTVAPRIEPARLTLEVRESMKQPTSFAPAWRAVLNYPLQHRLAQTRQPCLLIGASTDVFFAGLQSAAAVRPQAKVLEVADDDLHRAQAAVEFIPQACFAQD